MSNWLFALCVVVYILMGVLTYGILCGLDGTDRFAFGEFILSIVSWPIIFAFFIVSLLVTAVKHTIYALGYRIGDLLDDLDIF